MDMRDIAKLAGVSSATVSRVINGFNNVRPATAERVRRVIEETKFYPNSSATTLKHGKSSTYGLIIPDITNPFFPEFIRSFERIMVEWTRHAHGHHRLPRLAHPAVHPPHAHPQGRRRRAPGLRDRD